jgi:hypothetical protein
LIIAIVVKIVRFGFDWGAAGPLRADDDTAIVGELDLLDREFRIPSRTEDPTDDPLVVNHFPLWHGNTS